MHGMTARVSILMSLACSSAFAADATMTIDAGRPGVTVSPSLYGIFFEEINRAGEGGIYAEKVLNRSFEDDDKLTGWEFISGEGARGSMRVDKTMPLNPFSPNAVKLESLADSRGRVGIASDGFRGISGPYRGMHFQQGETYVGSLQIRGDGRFTGPVTVTLETADGKVLGRQAIGSFNTAWSRREFRLTASEAAVNGRLVVSIAQPGAVYMDVVSLFPQKTWKNRENGLRPDLMEFLDAMKPNFVRFPGGCWVEGQYMVNAYEWKQTIGDIGARRNQHNLWRYEVTHGLGYHEYLQMCEDLNADAMFVVNVGMAHSDATPMELMPQKVNDALDAIEYAIGETSTTWGAVRAANGHPKPFNLKYVEIGNENGGARYHERYPLFYNAIKAKYPRIQLISNVSEKSPGAGLDIIDEHYYNTPGFFMANANRYDKYDRKGPKIYVGEYAVTSGGQGNGNLRAALGEAAFMTGMERNSDVVIMSSYAPLFSHVHYKVWNPDAIYFDNARSCATPSYYVQQMFSVNRADTVLPLTIEASETPAAPRGQVGIGTWRTQAEFRDISLVSGGTPVPIPAFEQWKKSNGTWEQAGGIYRQTAEVDNAFLTFGPSELRDFTLSFKARKTAGAEGFLIPFHFRESSETALFNLGGWGNSASGVEFRGAAASELPRKDVKIEQNRWYDVRIETQGAKFRCFLDGVELFSGEYPAQKALYGVAGKSRNDIVLKVVNVTGTPQQTRLNIRGATGLRSSGTSVVLTAESPTAENTLDNPKQVVPVSKPVERVGPEFDYTFPANSVTILRLPAGN